MDLFDGAPLAKGAGSSPEPLAARMRPRTLDEVLGQDHIVGPGRLLRRAIQADRLSSVIFYGPPGTGKTTLARVIANSTKSSFVSLNAVLAGVKDVREAVEKAAERRKLYGTRTILFVDEVHRWNKAQQDALLPWVENGTVVLVGATTENPFFEVNRALVSRSRIFQLVALDGRALMEAARRALADRERGYGRWKVRFEEGALEHLVEVASGDVRSLLNALELAVETSCESWPPPDGTELAVSLAAAEESIQRRALLYDRDGDYHFDTISAFIKSLRGSDPDGALYWLAKMVRAGEDPAFIFRRMLISAGEDVGLADPNAVVVVSSCAAAFDRVGLPEGNFHLAEAALYLATAPKSNTALAYFDALKEVERQDAEVPSPLRDASRDGEAFAHGQGYLYPHAYRDHWVAQQYLPEALRGRIFYKPSAQGYEGRIRDGVLEKRELQAAALLAADAEGDAEGPAGETLTYAYASKDAEGWLRRLSSSRTESLRRIRDEVFSRRSTARHDRVLVAGADDGLLLWEAARRVPEGIAAGTVRNAGAAQALEAYASTLEELLRPVVKSVPKPETLIPAPSEAEAHFGTGTFELVVVRDALGAYLAAAAQGDRPPETALSAARTATAAAAALVVPGGAVVLVQSLPGRSSRLSELLSSYIGDPDLAGRFRSAEEAFFSSAPGAVASWTEEDVAAGFREALGLQRDDDAGKQDGAVNPDGPRPASGFGDFRSVVVDAEEERTLGVAEERRWFDPERSSWGAALAKSLGEPDFEALRSVFAQRAAAGPLPWSSAWSVVSARRLDG